MIPLEKIKKIVDKYKLIEKELASGDISKEELHYLRSINNEVNKCQ